MSWWGKVATGLGSVWDSAEDWFGGASQSSRQYRAQSSLDAATRAFESKEAEKAYQRQKEFFDYQADYNTPANQMARLRAAGLNPNLVYGNGAMAVQGSTGMVAQGHAGAPGNATGGTGNSGQLAGLLGLIGSTIRDAAQARKANEEAKGATAKATSQTMQNQMNVIDQIFGINSRVGKLAKSAVGVMNAMTVFPEQYTFLKEKLGSFADWAGSKYDEMRKWFQFGPDGHVDVVPPAKKINPKETPIEVHGPNGRKYDFNQRYHGFGGW